MGNTTLSNISGLGDSGAKVNVYIQNRPNFRFEQSLQNGQQQDCLPLTKGEINAIGQACGNGWRKVFNVYAKVIFALPLEYYVGKTPFPSWQHFRDEKLLQKLSNTALWFVEPEIGPANKLHIVMGRTYAKSLNLANTLQWINQEFAIDIYNQIIVCPYFDYRQLTNLKIIFLIDLIREHFSGLFAIKS